MDFMTIILAVVAVYVAKPAFTGKGKLMEIENVKEGKEKIAKKGLRICYLVMFFSSLLMILVTLFQNRGFTVNSYTVTFNDAYSVPGGTSYEKGQEVVMTAEELNALYTSNTSDSSSSSSSSSSGFSCAPSASNYVAVPCKYAPIYETTEYSEKLPGKDAAEKYQFIRTMSVILFGISLADIIFLLVFTNKMTDKAKKQKAQERAQTGRRPAMPSGAFNFDENEPVAPDDPKVSDPGKL